MKKELILFSGGVDSTVLLKFFLKKNKNLLVLYNDLSWCHNASPRLKIQKKKVLLLIDYFKKNYKDFEFTTSGIFLNLPYEPKLQFGTDDQWNVFLASIICRMYGIKKIWAASFSYGWNNRKMFNLPPPLWFTQKNMQHWINSATLNDNNFKDLQFLIPKFYYQGKEIDSLETKKEAWDYLENSLKKLVRSCVSDLDFCGKCYKCDTYILHKLKNINGKIL